MERTSQARTANLSVVVPSASNAAFTKQSPAVVRPLDHHFPPGTPSRFNAFVPAKQKRLFPVACRLVPTDQWFTTRVDRTWNVLDLKVWLLSKALPTSALPLPASYRPSSPVTFAAAPPPPLSRPSMSTSYQVPTPPADHISFQTLTSAQSHNSPISPITFATAPSTPALQSMLPIFPPMPSPMQHLSPTSPSPVQQTVSPPPSSPAHSPSYPASPRPLVPQSASSAVFPFDPNGDDMPLYPNPYGAILDDNSDGEDEDDDPVSHNMPRSIPYSYNTGAPAISGLAALKPPSYKNTLGRNYGGSISSVEMDLLRNATATAKTWHVYSFSTSMLLSDDLPLSEYHIRPYELLELHRAGAYVSLPRTILPALEPSSPSQNQHASRHSLKPTKTARAYPATKRGPPTPQHTQVDSRDAISSDSSDDEYDELPIGSPYAQPYFDGWVWVLREGVSVSTGSAEMGPNSMGTDELQGRKMRRRGRTKSDASKSSRGKDRTRMDREWKDLKQPTAKEGDVEEQRQDNSDRWKKRWLIIREGFITIWKERKDDLPEERYEIAACAGLFGADRLQSIMTAVPHNVLPFAASHFSSAASSYASTSTATISTPSSVQLPHVICARFRQRSSHSNAQKGKVGSKFSRISQQRNGDWLVLKVADESTHEHLLRIFHRVSYSTPVSSTSHPASSSVSVAPSRTLPTRTLRTDFLPNPIPHPLSLSFSAPSPIERAEQSPISPFDDPGPSDASEYDEGWVDAGTVWGQPRRRAVGRGVVKYVGLGRGIGVRYPEWREDIIRRAIYAGQGSSLPEPWTRPDLTPEGDTPRDDQLDKYGFSRDDLDNYAASLSREYDSDDPDSDAFSEDEWDGWAYDLDRPKVVNEIGGRAGNTRKTALHNLRTPQGSPASDDLQTSTVFGPVSDSASFPSTSTLRPRAQSFSSDNPGQSNVSSPPLHSPSSASPTTPSGRLRASTVSAHPHSPTFPVTTTPVNVPVPRLTSAASQTDFAPHANESNAMRTFEPNTVGGVRNLMRGLSMRAGKESFLRGLENALDFVEGK